MMPAMRQGQEVASCELRVASEGKGTLVSLLAAPARNSQLATRNFLPLAALGFSLLSISCVRAVKPLNPSPQESALIKKITVDPFTDIVAMQRADNGQLNIVTQQGDIQVTYEIKPTADDANVLAVYCIDRDVRLGVNEDQSAGTGPDARGLPTISKQQ
jgi:hypothetical protein